MMADISLYSFTVLCSKMYILLDSKFTFFECLPELLTVFLKHDLIQISEEFLTLLFFFSEYTYIYVYVHVYTYTQLLQVLELQ
jgi:hypothetical protein